jgi:hypothetical protein
MLRFVVRAAWRGVPWVCAAAIATGGCGTNAKPAGPFNNAPPPSRSPAAAAPPTSVPGSLIRNGPYRFVEPPLAAWTDYPNSRLGAAIVFVRLNRDIAYNAPLFALDGLGLALNSGGFSDLRTGHCYEAALNAGELPRGYYVGRIVTISLEITPVRGHPPGRLTIKVPLRPALAQLPNTESGPDTLPDPAEPYFRLLGCGHTRPTYATS